MSEQIQQLQRLQLAGTLAGGIAHDLNNQLTLVLGNIELALDHLPGEHAYDSLNLAKTAAGRCADMSRRLLYLARDTRTVMARVDIAAALVETQQMLECVKPGNVRVSVESESGLFILGNATQIQQVFINLWTNAFHAMERGGDLKIAAYRNLGRVNIVLQDTGCGIPKSLRQRIFEPFYTTRADKGGSGLGLASVLSIVESHGGMLGVESTVGKGSTFYMSFLALEADKPEPELDLAPEIGEN